MGRKRKFLEVLSGKNEQSTEEEENKPLPPLRISDDPIAKKGKWINKERVLIFSSRGISHRDRHLMTDLRTIMPHSKADTKLDTKEKLFVINEICEMKNCQKCLFFEAKKKKDLYLWASNCPQGPSAKFLIQNVHTMSELKLTGNCLKGTRPLLTFDKEFDRLPYLKALKELFIQIFGTPNHHPKSQPFIDHVFVFSLADNRIWFRNYQILAENGELSEIGPRMVMNPIKIFQGSFGGPVLYSNPKYITPNESRRIAKGKGKYKYLNRVESAKAREERKCSETYPLDVTDDVFQTDD